MQLIALRYFVMVAATGSFVGTARHFQVQPSSVSRFVSALEREVGQQLFYRNTRSVRLTEAGERYYLQVREVLDALDIATEQAAGKETDVRGLVRLNVPVALGRLHIAEIVNRLQAAHPDLSVELTLTDAYIDPIQEGADITLRIGRLADSGLIARRIGEQKYVLCAGSSYIKKFGKPRTPEDLRDHSCLSYKGLLGTQRWSFRQRDTDATHPVQVDGPLKSNDAEVLVAAALAGRGIVLFPTWMFDKTCFHSKKLVKLMPDWIPSQDPTPIDISLISPENRLRSHKVRVVLDFLLDAIGSPPYWDDI
ncbi:LysR substrate-binding domain-containing protein [Bordetella tumulicola]|uniref:LysR family transcriptional regulator n=1 Tax=Bordetella tumulicola TaxID=1649133 RepID=UPI0039EEDF14